MFEFMMIVPSAARTMRVIQVACVVAGVGLNVASWTVGPPCVRRLAATAAVAALLVVAAWVCGVRW